jgi:hypothetical protein
MAIEQLVDFMKIERLHVIHTRSFQLLSCGLATDSGVSGKRGEITRPILFLHVKATSFLVCQA